MGVRYHGRLTANHSLNKVCWSTANDTKCMTAPRESGVRAYRAEGSVSECLIHLSETGTGPWLVLIRGWDSTRDPTYLHGAIRRWGWHAELLASGCLVEMEDSQQLLERAGQFFGFDEVWIGTPSTDWDALAHLPVMTSEQVDVSQSEGQPFLDAYRKASATWAFGDGAGVNVIGPYWPLSSHGA